MQEEGTTTIQLKKSVVKALKQAKRYPRETYNEVITDLIKNKQETADHDEFLQKAQKAKMKELWGNGDYTGWERA